LRCRALLLMLHLARMLNGIDSWELLLLNRLLDETPAQLEAADGGGRSPLLFSVIYSQVGRVGQVPRDCSHVHHLTRMPPPPPNPTKTHTHVS
jgi:hypothetical protein